LGLVIEAMARAAASDAPNYLSDDGEQSPRVQRT
jgi:hypothetical protein